MKHQLSTTQQLINKQHDNPFTMAGVQIPWPCFIIENYLQDTFDNVSKITDLL